MAVSFPSASPVRSSGRPSDDILRGPIAGALLRLAGPVVLANVLQTVYQLTDTFWVGRLGAVAVAAVSFSFPVIFLFIAVALSAAFVFLPPVLMLVICYLITRGNMKMFAALDSNRRHAAAVEEVVRTVGEVALPVANHVMAANKYDRVPGEPSPPACSARAG